MIYNFFDLIWIIASFQFSSILQTINYKFNIYHNNSIMKNIYIFYIKSINNCNWSILYRWCDTIWLTRWIDETILLASRGDGWVHVTACVPRMRRRLQRILHYIQLQLLLQLQRDRLINQARYGSIININWAILDNTSFWMPPNSQNI